MADHRTPRNEKSTAQREGKPVTGTGGKHRPENIPADKRTDPTKDYR